MPRLSSPGHAAPVRRLGAARPEPTEIVRARGRLREVVAPGENVRQLRRPLPPALQEALASIDDLPLFEAKRQIRTATDLGWLTELIDARRARALLPDLTRWLEALQDLAGPGETFEGCLLVTRDDDCRKYHVDWVRLRLIVTYCGVGTEWVRSADVNRAALTKDWCSLSQINREIVPDAQAVHRAGAGDVLVLKGETFPGNAGNGAVHRSPPIALQGRARLVFKLTLK